jgi:hypothetical protein
LGSAIGSSNVFQFTYRAPTDGIGSIRFNVAGNAANGNGTPTGDFIYAAESVVPILAPSQELQFVMATRGGASIRSGSTRILTAGFGRLITTSGTSGSGLGFISYRQGNVLVSETAFSASAPIRSGRVYTEVGAGLNTGIALANPNSEPAAVSFFFTDDAGTDFGTSTFTIGPNSQVAAFVGAAPFTISTASPKTVTDARTFSFSSNVPIAAVAFRTRTNERGDLLFTNLRVADTGTSSRAVISIPEIVDGGGWTSEILLVNTTDAAETGKLQFMSSVGEKMNVVISTQSSDQFTYSIPAHSSRRLKTAGSGSTLSSGWVEISPDANTQTPAATGVLSTRVNNVTVTETSIAGIAAANSFRVYAELAGNFGRREAGSIQTGLTISNPATAPVMVTVEATNPDGTLRLGTTTISVPARGQVGLRAGSLPGLSLPAPFTGLLWVTAPIGSNIAVSGIRSRYSDRDSPDELFTGFPAIDETAVQPDVLVFPQIVGSGGYSTQFVLMGVRGGQSSTRLQFLSQTGQFLPLFVR